MALLDKVTVSVLLSDRVLLLAELATKLNLALLPSTTPVVPVTGTWASTIRPVD